MLESFTGIFSKLKRGSNNSLRKDNDSGGKVYALWLLVLPFLAGGVFGCLVDTGLGFCFDMISGNAGVRDEAVTGSRSNSENDGRQRGFDSFLASNPFRISPMKTDIPLPPPEPQEEPEEPKPQEPGTADHITLKATFPGAGAYFSVRNIPDVLVPVGEEIDYYKLISVGAYEAILRRGNEPPVKKYIVYGSVPAPEQAEAPKAASAPAKAPEVKQPPAPQNSGNILAAVPGGNEGQVPSEIVNQLVQNPFDELKRIRLRPNDKSGGLEIQWIQNDSILKRLGIQRGDVIKSVNGIPFTNMGDIANSISSLMASERFDVEVNRGGNNTALRYVVK